MGNTVPGHGPIPQTTDATIPANYMVAPDRSSTAKKGTIISGQEQAVNTVNPAENRTLVGFLVSFSRTDFGEYWPLREGNNLIGTGNDCDARLSEATVSQHHAVLTARVNKNDGQMMVAITDKQSSNGTLLNGNDLGINGSAPCKHGDKLGIGNYELLIMLCGRQEHGLSRSESFKELQAAPSIFDYSSRDLYSDGTKPGY